jgi:hypothetical protein
MGTVDDSKDKVADAVQTRGEQLDEAVAKVGEVIEEKLTPVAENVTEKFLEKTGGYPGDKSR